MADDPPDAAQDSLDLCFSAEASAVRQALRQTMERFARRIGKDDAGSLELALAEVLNNVVEHAYAGRPPGPVRLSLIRESGAVGCLIEDEGRPMPRFRLPDNGAQCSSGRVEDLTEGGWGWALIRALTLDLRYERRNRCNRLSFRLPLGGPPSAAAP